jgi:hypothetical protein
MKRMKTAGIGSIWRDQYSILFLVTKMAADPLFMFLDRQLNPIIIRPAQALVLELADRHG